MLYDRPTLYDLIYENKPYASEAVRLHSLLSREGVPTGDLLEVACGTGKFLEPLSQYFDVRGIDLSPSMAEAARAKGFDAQFGDMRDFTAPAADVLVCLFSSIGYLLDDEDLLGTLRCFHAVAPLVVIEPWLRPDMVDDGRVSLDVVDRPDLKVVRTSYITVDGDMTEIEFEWVVAQRDHGIEHFSETHVMRMVETDRMLSLLSEAGFDARFEEEGLMPDRGLYVARR